MNLTKPLGIGKWTAGWKEMNEGKRKVAGSQDTHAVVPTFGCTSVDAGAGLGVPAPRSHHWKELPSERTQLHPEEGSFRD